MIGPLAGVLGMVVAVVGLLLQRRGQSHVEVVDTERLGHADLVAALEMYRVLVVDLRADMAALEREAAEWQSKHAACQTKLADLLFLLETRREDR